MSQTRAAPAAAPVPTSDPPEPPDARSRLDWLRPLARRLRAGSTALLHPARRARARRQVRRLAPRSILFVCHGNINRSAYAEAFFRGACDRQVSVASAGFVGPGRGSPVVAREVAEARGVSLESHRSRLVEPALVVAADLVVVMDEPQARRLRARYGVRAERVLLLGDLDPEIPGRRPVQDPVDRPPAEFDRVFGRIERCVNELIRCLPR